MEMVILKIYESFVRLCFFSRIKQASTVSRKISQKHVSVLYTRSLLIKLCANKFIN